MVLARLRRIFCIISRSRLTPCLIYGSNACRLTDGYIKRSTENYISLEREIIHSTADMESFRPADYPRRFFANAGSAPEDR
jgi:hypothetical protein